MTNDNTNKPHSVKEKEKINLNFIYHNIDQDKQKNWSKVYKKKFDDSVVGVIEYFEVTESDKF